MTIATLTSKGQMTLPKEVRDDLGLRPGDKLDIVKERGQYVLRPRNVKADDLYGILHRPSERPMTLEEEDAAYTTALAEEDERIRAGR